MNLYIDKANLESYIKGCVNDEGRFYMCNLMLKKNLDTHLNLSKEEFMRSEIFMNWARTILDGRGSNKIYFESGPRIFPPRPINVKTFGKDFHSEDKWAGVYLINDPSSAEISKSGSYLVSGLGDEIATLSRLAIGDEENRFMQSLPIRNFFINHWEGLDNAILPCSDLIISDPYILSSPELLPMNLYALIKKLTECVNKSPVNIVIFCLQETTRKKGDASTKVSPDWETVRFGIKEMLKEKEIDSNITFVAAANEAQFKEHDRTVCTNYLYYTPGSTLNFYDKSGKLTSRGRHFHVHSLVYRSFYEEAMAFINDMQTLIEDIEDGKTEGIIRKDTGLNISNIFTFF